MKTIKTNQPLNLIFIRLGLLLLGAVITQGLIILTKVGGDFPPNPLLASMYFVVVNLICLSLIRRKLAEQGMSIAEFLGFDKQRLPKDIAWGFLWIFVLYLPFVAALMLGMFMKFGATLFDHFAEVFAPTSVTRLPYALNLIFALILALIFPVVNAPVEEMYYRGWALQGMKAKYSVAIAIVIQAVFFGIQHMLLAPSPTGVLIYALMFFVWGLGAGIIAHKQQRLMPVVLAHFITNLVFSVAPLILVLTGVMN